jgi:hypothetical protein
LGPPTAVEEPHDAGSLGRSATIRRPVEYDPGHVLPRPPALRPTLEQPQFSSVNRKRVNLDDRFLWRRLRLFDLTNFSQLLAVRRIH